MASTSPQPPLTNRQNNSPRCSEPIGAICDPPGSSQNRNCRSQRPPEWQRKIRDQSQAAKRQPEYLSLHASSIAAKSTLRSRACRIVTTQTSFRKLRPRSRPTTMIIDPSTTRPPFAAKQKRNTICIVFHFFPPLCNPADFQCTARGELAPAGFDVGPAEGTTGGAIGSFSSAFCSTSSSVCT